MTVRLKGRAFPPTHDYYRSFRRPRSCLRRNGAFSGEALSPRQSLDGRRRPLRGFSRARRTTMEVVVGAQEQPDNEDATGGGWNFRRDADSKFQDGEDPLWRNIEKTRHSLWCSLSLRRHMIGGDLEDPCFCKGARWWRKSGIPMDENATALCEAATYATCESHLPPTCDVDEDVSEAGLDVSDT
ncbi:hypothetical protein LXL04_015532 [Taraxacum kok-saghyz]